MRAPTLSDKILQTAVASTCIPFVIFLTLGDGDDLYVKWTQQIFGGKWEKTEQGKRWVQTSAGLRMSAAVYVALVVIAFWAITSNTWRIS